MKRLLIVVGLVAATLAGCQTPQESLADATDVCRSSGYRPGTRAYADCLSGTYAQNRRASQETGNAIATGVVAGVVGGAIVGAAARPYGYGYGYRRYGYGWY